MVSNSVPQSNHVGVKWNSRFKKWEGVIFDSLQTSKSGGKKFIHAGRFDNEDDCAIAVAFLRKDAEERFLSHTTNLAMNDPICKQLPMGPKNAEEAKKGIAYWRPHKRKNHSPFKAVRVAVGGKAKWIQACVVPGCSTIAKPPSSMSCVHHRFDKHTLDLPSSLRMPSRSTFEEDIAIALEQIYSAE